MIRTITNHFPIIGLIVYGFILRLWGLNQGVSFWTDENHTAIFARAILDRGQPVLANGYTTGYYQIFLYWITAIPMKIFGISEFSARLSSVIFGTLTIGAIYLLGKELFSKKVGYISAILVTLLQIEILWSRQVRPYQGLQLCYILAAWFIYRFVNKTGNPKWNLSGFFLIGVFATGLHGLGAVIIPAGLLYLFIVDWRKNLRIGLIAGIVALIFTSLNWQILLSLTNTVGKINNLFYYRVFLTHNYLPLCILAFIGGLGLLVKKDFRRLAFLAVFFLPQLAIVSFFLGQPFVRYLYIVLPFVYVLASYAVILMAQYLVYEIQRIRPIKTITSKQKSTNQNYLITQLLFTVVLASFLMFNLNRSNKLTLIPQMSYSLNNDMQEVPEVDWKKVYGFVGEKMSKNKDMVLVTNWNDQPIWYFGEDFKDRFIMIRAADKIVPEIDVYGERVIYSIQELEGIKNTYPKGLIIADSWDNLVPEGYREYLQTNFKLVMEVDRLYPVQPRYWTVWVYSWGLE